MTLKPKIREADVLRAILDYLAIKKVFHFRCNTMGTPLPNGGFRPAPATGVPDIIAVIKGQFIGIEAKAPQGRVSEAQEAFGRGLEKAGGRYLIARSVDDVISFLTQVP